MQRLPHLRILFNDEPQSGAWNMAVDEVLLESAIAASLPTLRLYRWQEPTASLGYFQRMSEFLADARFASLPVVRRLSGGGTLIHDRDLTYSLALPATQRLVDHPVELYKLVHDAFITVFQRHGIMIEKRGVSIVRKQEPLLCFAREDEHDLVLHGRKVLGSAQRRRRGAILQHGGLIIETSAITPELTGLRNLERNIPSDAYEAELVTCLASIMSDVAVFGTLTEDELVLARQLLVRTYGVPAHSEGGR